MNALAGVLGGLAALALAAPAWAEGTIRVAVLEAGAVAELRGSAIEVSAWDGCQRCPGRAWRADRIRAVVAGGGIAIDGRLAGAFRLESRHPIWMNGRAYPPRLELIRNGGGIAVVNELPLEEYVAGVLLAEADERWPFEALRAQAVVARTYAAYHRLLNAGKGYHLVASTAHQQYAGWVARTSPAWAAVEETRGQVLFWEGALFPAFYHTESGGYTEDPRLVFEARNMPALKPVVCPFSAGSPYFTWALDLRLSDLAAALRRGGVDVGIITGIEVAERTRSLRAAFVTVRGTRGTVRLRGNDFRRMIGYDTLKSTLFAVAIDRGTARFAGRGYGHGVGLCQWGARGMAGQGYSARQILEFYYPGAVLGILGDAPPPR